MICGGRASEWHWDFPLRFLKHVQDALMGKEQLVLLTTLSPGSGNRSDRREEIQLFEYAKGNLAKVVSLVRESYPKMPRWPKKSG